MHSVYGVRMDGTGTYHGVALIVDLACQLKVDTAQNGALFAVNLQ